MGPVHSGVVHTASSDTSFMCGWSVKWSMFVMVYVFSSAHISVSNNTGYLNIWILN